ncbi:SCAN domain-containing protein 3 [Nephila pilipes]|uniref:SCAN domain-containing protein 3 n=1 Tax=Nephila pilipes TaxID=299642 RepID=A0A8X6P7Y7_NEPPI|nr:SCAN domain-containing protein 3 [Nephila pilipes]
MFLPLTIIIINYLTELCMVNVLRMKFFKFYTPLNMDKFLHRKDSSSRTDDEEPSTSVTKNIKKVVKRKYDDDYIKYGFSWCGDETAPRPQCII